MGQANQGQQPPLDTDGTALAPEGKTWVCCACGKKSRSMYGFDAQNKRVASGGWDESCVLNASLFDNRQLVHDLYGRVIQVLPMPSESSGESEGNAK
jgi:hypothetical protein